MKTTIAIIGAGNMGGAFYTGMSRHLTRVRINVCDRSKAKAEALDAEHVYTDPAKAIKDAEVVLLAVKPQSAQELLAPLCRDFDGRLVISVMAGITLASLQKMTRCPSIIRAMPNLPAKVGRGLTGWVAGPKVPDRQREFARELFLSVGQEIELEKESMLDALTPLSGSGPAYFYLLAELLAAKAIKEGFTDVQAGLLARETLIGSARLLEAGMETPARLRAAVTSKAGVTEAALRAMTDRNLSAIVDEAIDKAILRSRELNQ